MQQSCWGLARALEPLSLGLAGYLFEHPETMRGWTATSCVLLSIISVRSQDPGRSESSCQGLLEPERESMSLPGLASPYG
jgi:hypothetical protein